MANTGCAGSAIAVAPICLNFGITAPVLSCVMTWRGRIEIKSPLRTAAPGGSPSACRAAIFSTSVRPISIFVLNKVHEGHVKFICVRFLKRVLFCGVGRPKFERYRWSYETENGTENAAGWLGECPVHG